MAKIIGGDDLPEAERLRLIQAATGKSERGARMILARSSGQPAGDVTYRGTPLDLRRAEPVAVVYVANVVGSATVKAIRSADNWSLWRHAFPSASPSTSSVPAPAPLPAG